MKKLPTTIWFLTGFYLAVAQSKFHDSNWVLGTKTSIIFFDNDTILVDTLKQNTPFFNTSACISDENGKLLFVCYGSAVTDKGGDKLLNGDTLSPCQYTYSNPFGFAIPQAAMFLPMPGNSRFYYLFHFSLDTLNNGRPGTLYYSVIDKEGNFGLGEVIDKNHVFYSGIFRGGGMTATKHANGRDWWVVMGGRNNNRYNIFLLTPDGIDDTLTQYIGPNYNGPYDVSYSCFSKDGTKYATGAYEGSITVMDFDRCTGEFSTPIVLANISKGFTISGTSSLAFSPNGQFLYAASRVDLKQYDLHASNIQQDTAMLYLADTADFAQLDMLQLAPDGKIYGSTWNGGFKFLHVVNNPNEKGDSCHFVYGGQPTSSANSTQLPNMPNYRLGALAGSGCDTLQTDIREERTDDRQQPRVFPNPADKAFYIEMPAPACAGSGKPQCNYVFELYNEQGQLVEKRTTKQVDIINVEQWQSGVYFLSVKDKSGKVLSTQQVVVRY